MKLKSTSEGVKFCISEPLVYLKVVKDKCIHCKCWLILTNCGEKICRIQQRIYFVTDYLQRSQVASKWKIFWRVAAETYHEKMSYFAMWKSDKNQPISRVFKIYLGIKITIMYLKDTSCSRKKNQSCTINDSKLKNPAKWKSIIQIVFVDYLTLAVEVLHCFTGLVKIMFLFPYQVLQEHYQFLCSILRSKLSFSCHCSHAGVSPGPAFHQRFLIVLAVGSNTMLLLCLHCFSWLIWALCPLWLPWTTCGEMHLPECVGKPLGFTGWGAWWLYLVVSGAGYMTAERLR